MFRRPVWLCIRLFGVQNGFHRTDNWPPNRHHANWQTKRMGFALLGELQLSFPVATEFKCELNIPF